MHFPVFKDLGTADLKIVSPLFHVRTYPAGAIVIEQGERAACLYLLVQGEVMLRYKPYDGDQINLNRLSAGSVFGWSAVLGNDVYSSSAVCISDCETLLIAGKDLRDLQIVHPQTGQVVLNHLAEAVSSRWANAQMQVRSMINQGVTHRVPPLEKDRRVVSEVSMVVTTKEQQLRALLEQLNAYIEQYHGGSVDFVSFDGEKLAVRLGGACLGCPLLPSTLHGWVAGTVRQFFPDVEVVEAG